MKINRILLVTLMLLTLSLSSVSFATENVIVPNKSGESSTSGDVTPPSSGETGSGEIVTPPASGEPGIDETGSGEIDTDILKSQAVASKYEILENSKLSASLDANIVSGENVSYAITVQPTHGTVVQSGESGKNYIYTPEKDYHGTDSFSFRLEEGKKYSNSATVSITIKQDTSNVIPFNYIDMKDHWANYSASHLAARGLIIGEEIGNRFYFKPEKTMTRGEFMLFLLAITESNVDAEIDVSKVKFADSSSTPDWLLEAAKVAYSRGILKGSAEGEKIYLNLDRTITRAEAATMISNVLGDKDSTKEIKYKDVGMIPSWALKAVKNLSAYKIIQGDVAGTFRPMSKLTRGEAAELSFKLLKQLEQKSMASSGDIK